jgi:ADP-ribose pyrophosphatase
MGQAEFALVKERYVLRSRVFAVRRESWHEASGNSYQRDTIVHSGAVAILPFDKRGRIVLIRQFRAAVREWLLEIPAGTLERGESPLKCAKRELIEETGFAARTWRKLGCVYTTPGFCTERIHLFEARNLRPATAEKDEDERIEVAAMSLAHIRRAVRAGAICDAKTLAALMCYATK